MPYHFHLPGLRVMAREEEAWARAMPTWGLWWLVVVVVAGGTEASCSWQQPCQRWQSHNLHLLCLPPTAALPHYLVQDRRHPCRFVGPHAAVVGLLLHPTGVTHERCELRPIVGQQVCELKEDKYIITLFRFSIDMTDSPATSATHTFGT